MDGRRAPHPSPVSKSVVRYMWGGVVLLLRAAPALLLLSLLVSTRYDVRHHARVGGGHQVGGVVAVGLGRPFPGTLGPAPAFSRARLPQLLLLPDP